jgi:hypothetical protein
MNGYGYGSLPGIGARDPEPTEDEEQEPVEWPRLCPWCEEKPPVDEFGFYCSEACVHEAGTLEPYSSVHPRPEEVG